MKKVLTFGVFDYFHIGHLRLFKQCKEHGDYLIVAVQRDEFIKKFKPDAVVMYSTSERIEMLESLRIVDKVIPYDDVSVTTIENIDFDILALGEDHRGERFDRIIEWCEKNCKDIIRLKRTQGISSTQIKDEMKKDVK